MINLSEKFKKATKNSRVTSLYPVVRFYKNVKLDEKETWNTAESINISTKAIVLNKINFQPLLLDIPNITSSADIINNKFTISTVNFNISNMPFNGKIFSDNISDILNSVCQIYYCANGIDTIDDCMLIYTGTVRKYKQLSNVVKITLEDITQQLLQLNIPSTLVPENDVFSKSDTGKPFPMVYGFVDKSPLIKQYIGLNNVGTLQNRLAQLHIDKSFAFIGGLWDSNTIDYNLPSNHRLFTENILNTSDAHVYVWDNNNYTPIHREIPEDWGFGQYTVSSNENSRIAYDFNLQYNINSESTIKLNTGSVIGGSDIGLPSRIYRPIDECEFFTYNDNNNGNNGHSINKIYGFTEFTSGGPSFFKPYKIDNVYNDDYYDINWQNSQTWWQPTACNENVNGGVFGRQDENWLAYGRLGHFPVERLQDGTMGTGLWFTAKNEDGARDDGAASGGCFVRMILKDNVGEHPCGTAVYYDAECHSFDNMNQPDEMPYHAQFWTNRELIEQLDEVSDLIDGNNCETVGEIKDVGAPVTSESAYLPNPEFVDVVYNDQSGTEDSVRKLTGKAIATTFVKTNEFDSIQFGIPQYNKLGDAAGGHTGYISTQIFNAWIVQDALISNPIEQDYYASVAGRSQLINNPFVSETFFASEIEIKTVDDTIIDEYEYVLLLGNNQTDSRLMAERISDIRRVEGQDGTTIYLQIITPDIYKNIYDNFNEPFLGDNGMYYVKVTDLPIGSFNQVGIYQVQLEFFLNTDEPITQLITGSDKILKNILQSELNYQGNIESSIPRDDWQFSFTLFEQKKAKEFLEDFFKSTLQIPSYNQNGDFKFIELKQIIDSYDDVYLIENKDVMKYSYDLTDLDDIYTSINVKYAKNYANDSYDKETGFSLQDGNYNLYENYQELSEYIENDTNISYNINYYNLTHDKCKLEFESDYIRDDDTARKLQKRLVNWYANQHLTISIDLPLKYIDLEVGDYIRFDNLIEDKLAFGYNYSITERRNGQLIYNIFFIKKIQKKINSVSLDLIQIHRGQYGFPETDQIGNGNSPLVDDGSVDGRGNHNMPDPSDNPNYNFDKITEEFQTAEEDIDFFEIYWLSTGNISLESQILEAVVNTNILENWNYNIYVTSVESTEGFIPFPEDAGLPFNALLDGIYSEENAPSAMNIVNHSKSVSDLFENFNGTITLSKKYDIIVENPNDFASITFILKVFNSQYEQYIPFTQKAESYTTYLNGDVNNDSILNILDIVIIVNWILIASEAEDGFGFLSIPEFGAADFNNDGDINVLDVVALVNRILTQG